MAITSIVPPSFGDVPDLTEKQLDSLSEVSELERMDAITFWKTAVPPEFFDLLNAEEVISEDA